MTADEARACFDRALDDELSSDDRRAFEAALATDERLRAEFAELREMQQRTRALGATPPVDLLSGVQARLRQRSGGRFYRDRFSEQRGRSRLPVLILAAAALVLALVAAFIALNAVSLQGP